MILKDIIYTINFGYHNYFFNEQDELTIKPLSKDTPIKLVYYWYSADMNETDKNFIKDLLQKGEFYKAWVYSKGISNEIKDSISVYNAKELKDIKTLNEGYIGHIPAVLFFKSVDIIIEYSEKNEELKYYNVLGEDNEKY